MSEHLKVIHDSEDKMKKSLDAVQQNFSSIRSGRASSGMVQTPLKQMANISVPEPRMIVLHPWDISAIKAVEKALMESDLGIPPVVDGKIIRLAVPPLTRERREELIKIVHKQAEEGHVSVRSIRRDANERVKQLEKEKKITEDDSFKAQAEIQKLTDKYIQLIDQAQSAKEKELAPN